MINLSTPTKDIIRTMQKELPSEEYQFRKAHGGNKKYAIYEDQLLDKALAEQQSLCTDVNAHISASGNRWMTFVHVEYFPKALYALATHISFIYYETYASCGAFFPILKQQKNKKKSSKVEGVITFTAHFFQRMSERTGKAYRSKELIREFISTRCSLAPIEADEDGEVIVKFKGGYGFGVQKSTKPKVIEVRTFLTDEMLSPSQHRKCERIDAYAELMKDGQCYEAVARNQALLSNDSLEEVANKGLHNLELAKKIGADRYMLLHAMVFMAFCGFAVEINHMKEDPQVAAATLAPTVADVATPFVMKYEHFDKRTATDEENEQFKQDLIDILLKAAKKLHLQGWSHDIIASRLNNLDPSKFSE